MTLNQLSTLPNNHGFQFIGVSHEGENIPCEVRKNAVGFHDVYRMDNNSPCFSILQGWLPMFFSDETPRH